MSDAKDTKIRQINITFPVGIEPPPGFMQTLDALVNMVCEAYEKENPHRVMWPAGSGFPYDVRGRHIESLALMGDDAVGEAETDWSIYAIDVKEREAREKDLKKRGFIVGMATCNVCGCVLYRRKESRSWLCPNEHIQDNDGGTDPPPLV